MLLLENVTLMHKEYTMFTLAQFLISPILNLFTIIQPQFMKIHAYAYVPFHPIHRIFVYTFPNIHTTAVWVLLIGWSCPLGHPLRVCAVMI